MIAETRQLLTEHARMIAPTTTRFPSAAALREFISSGQCEPVRSKVSDLLADPDLTAMSRTDLREMTERVRHVLEARGERHRHRRRGGERLPGARGGVFTRKITNDERVLATVLYQRKLCTHDVLAELFQVSRRTIGDVVREVGPSWPRTATPPSRPLPGSPAPRPYSTRSTTTKPRHGHEE